MSPDRRLTFHALCVIEQTLKQAQEGRVQGTPALRLALGYLHAAADRQSEYFSEKTYATFWLEATGGTELGPGTAQGFGRVQTLNSCANGMAHAAGMPRDHLYDAALRRLKLS